MNSEIKRILEAVRSGELPVEDALLRLKEKPLRISAMLRWIYIGRSVRERRK